MEPWSLDPTAQEWHELPLLSLNWPEQGDKCNFTMSLHGGELEVLDNTDVPYHRLF